ncbi:MAG: hypothetical protein P8Y01_00575 [Woeseiaceae bacterium]|jgi:hypothetical protein
MFHQLAFLTPRRAVAWKCLSLEATGRGSAKRFAPVAYASLSRSFFPHLEGHDSPGVLWVVSQPVYRRRGAATIVFPPTLTAKLVADRIVTGDIVRTWAADERDCDLTIPASEDDFQRWRKAPSVRGPARRAAFRIARNFARIKWIKLGKGRHRQEKAWQAVRTAFADRAKSSFLAHVDARTCLEKALRLPARSKAGSRLQSPRQVQDQRCIATLEDLAERGRKHTIFMNYRWNDESIVVARLAKALLARRCGVWLDGLAIPHFAQNPVWRTNREQRRKDPPRVDLERLLNQGIEDSALFLCLATGDYYDPPEGKPEGTPNWAMQEYQRATRRFSGPRSQNIRVVDLCGAPVTLLRENRGRVWKYDRNIIELAKCVAAVAHRS